MQKRTFDFCALHFLNQWMDREARIHEMLADTEEEKRRMALSEAGAYFKVARNLPTQYEDGNGVTRYQPILEILNRIETINPADVVSTVAGTERSISDYYGGRKALSLTTKFLWLKVRSPVRIYDRQARVALGTREGDYEEFNEAFSVFFENHSQQVADACHALKSVMNYSVRPDLAKDALEELTSEIWFQERVVDIYLWHAGNG